MSKPAAADDEEEQTLVPRENGTAPHVTKTETTDKRWLSMYNICFFAGCVLLLLLVGSGVAGFYSVKKTPNTPSTNQFDQENSPDVDEFSSIVELDDEEDDYELDQDVESRTESPKKAATKAPTSKVTKKTRKETKKPVQETTAAPEDDSEEEGGNDGLGEKDEDESVEMLAEEAAHDPEYEANEKTTAPTAIPDAEDTEGDEEADDDNPLPTDSEDAEELKNFIRNEDGEDSNEDEDYDESDRNPDHVPAPRTTDFEYNEMDHTRSYILYNPSGGMTNQELELVNAMHMARTLQRTLYIPMIGRHSNLPSGYNALGPRDLFPADRLFDFEWLNKYCRAVPLNITVKAMVTRVARKLGAHNVRYVATDVGYNGNAAARTLKAARNNLIFFNGKGMWGRWWGLQPRTTARHYISFSPYVRELAMRIADAEFGPRFYAIHGRLGDEAYRWEGKDSGAVFVHTHQFSKWDKSLKLYLASDDPSNSFFRDLKSKIKVLTSHDLKSKEVQEFRNLFPNRRVMQDMFGVLDKLICTQAIGFMGSFFSTFSIEIHVMRGTARFIYPELYARKHNLTNFERKPEVALPTL